MKILIHITKSKALTTKKGKPREKVDCMKRKLRITFMIILIMMISLVGCKKKDDNGQENNNENKNTIGEMNENEQEENEEVTYDYSYPLTGVATNEEVNNRAVGVMINNHPAARPQSGLSQADIVFEILAEGSTTRYLALFQSEMPDLVGPVRSAREYYFELAKDYEAIYVYHGAAEFVNSMIVNRGIEFLNGAVHDNDQKIFKRESFRKAPHNSYFILNKAYEFAQAKGYETTGTVQNLPFLEVEEKPVGDKKGTYAKIGYIGQQPSYTVEYQYDEANESYIRSADGVQDQELNGEIPVRADNVLIMETHHEVFDNEGRRKVDMQSGGSAILLQKGIQQEVRWENRDGVILAVKDGELVPFTPGKTWINVVPSLEQSVEVSGE